MYDTVQRTVKKIPHICLDINGGRTWPITASGSEVYAVSCIHSFLVNGLTDEKG